MSECNRIPFTVPTKAGECIIHLDAKQVNAFSEGFYPLTQRTLDVFYSTFPKEVRERLQGQVEEKEIEAVYQAQLQESVSLLLG